MLLQSGIPPVRGSCLEIRRGPTVIVARVVWTKGHRFGVKSQDVLSLAAIVGDSPDAVPPVTDRTGDRRRVKRQQLPSSERNRLRGRMIEYGFTAALALAAAAFAAGQVYSFLSRPAEVITATLSDTNAGPR